MIIIQINFLYNISSTQIACTVEFTAQLKISFSQLARVANVAWRSQSVYSISHARRFEGGEFGRRNSLCYAQNQPNHPKADWLFLSDKMPSRKNQTKKKTISHKDFLRLSFFLCFASGQHYFFHLSCTWYEKEFGRHNHRTSSSWWDWVGAKAIWWWLRKNYTPLAISSAVLLWTLEMQLSWFHPNSTDVNSSISTFALLFFFEQHFFYGINFRFTVIFSSFSSFYL